MDPATADAKTSDPVVATADELRAMTEPPHPQDRSEQFHEVYPADLPHRLDWLESHLHLRRERVLRMAGAQAAVERHARWEDLLERKAVKRSRAAAAEDALREYLSVFLYDWPYVTGHVFEQARADRAAGRPVLGLTGVRSDGGLLVLIYRGGIETFVPAVTAFLTNEPR